MDKIWRTDEAFVKTQEDSFVITESDIKSHSIFWDSKLLGAHIEVVDPRTGLTIIGTVIGFHETYMYVETKKGKMAFINIDRDVQIQIPNLIFTVTANGVEHVLTKRNDGSILVEIDEDVISYIIPREIASKIKEIS